MFSHELRGEISMLIHAIGVVQDGQDALLRSRQYSAGYDLAWEGTFRWR